MTLSTAIRIGGESSGSSRDWPEKVKYVRSAENLGVDMCWSAEAWGQDAATPLAYLAAVTSRIGLGSRVMQISARTPAMTAMTALTLAALSNDRFVLGLGVSGPQVVEGLHGVPFERPLARLREYVDIVRLAFSGEEIAYTGEYFQLPLPESQGKSLRMSQKAPCAIPIYVAAIGPKAVQLTGEIADGWLASRFVPEESRLPIEALQAGALRAKRNVATIARVAEVSVALGEDLSRVVDPIKKNMAYQIGAMGSDSHNFYADAYSRMGYEDVVLEIQHLWRDGKRDKACTLVPMELIVKENLVGTDEMVRARVRAHLAAGVTMLMLKSPGKSNSLELDQLEHVLSLIAEADGE